MPACTAGWRVLTPAVHHLRVTGRRNHFGRGHARRRQNARRASRRQRIPSHFRQLSCEIDDAFLGRHAEQGGASGHSGRLGRATASSERRADFGTKPGSRNRPAARPQKRRGAAAARHARSQGGGRLRKQDVLHGENPSGERLGRVVREHRHRPLRHDPAAVVAFVDIVHGRARNLRARGQHGLVDSATMHPLAPERRQRPRMHVEHATPIGSANFRVHELEKTGEQDAVDAVLPQDVQQTRTLAAMRSEAGSAGRAAPAAGALLGGAISVGHQNFHAVRRFGPLVIQQRLQVGARPGGEHRESRRHANASGPGEAKNGLVLRSCSTVVGGPCPG